MPAQINEFISNHARQIECVIEFTVDKQSVVGGDMGIMELGLQAALKIKPQWLVSRVIRRVHDWPHLQTP